MFKTKPHTVVIHNAVYLHYICYERINAINGSTYVYVPYSGLFFQGANFPNWWTFSLNRNFPDLEIHDHYTWLKISREVYLHVLMRDECCQHFSSPCIQEHLNAGNGWSACLWMRATQHSLSICSCCVQRIYHCRTWISKYLNPIILPSKVVRSLEWIFPNR